MITNIETTQVRIVWPLAQRDLVWDTNLGRWTWDGEQGAETTVMDLDRAYALIASNPYLSTNKAHGMICVEWAK